MDQSLEVIEIEDIDNPNSLYSKETKLKAVSLYLVKATLQEVAKELKIPYQTISNWKLHSPWWDEAFSKLKKERQHELEVLLSNSIHKAIEEINDRFKYGDHKLDTKSGDLVRVPLNAKDLSLIFSTLYDKRALIRGEATSIRSESVATLSSLSDKFKEFAVKLKEKDLVSTQ